MGRPQRNAIVQVCDVRIGLALDAEITRGRPPVCSLDGRCGGLLRDFAVPLFPTGPEHVGELFLKEGIRRRLASGSRRTTCSAIYPSSPWSPEGGSRRHLKLSHSPASRCAQAVASSRAAALLSTSTGTRKSIGGPGLHRPPTRDSRLVKLLGGRLGGGVARRRITRRWSCGQSARLPLVGRVAYERVGDWLSNFFLRKIGVKTARERTPANRRLLWLSMRAGLIIVAFEAWAFSTHHVAVGVAMLIAGLLLFLGFVKRLSNGPGRTIDHRRDPGGSLRLHPRDDMGVLPASLSGLV